MRKLKLFAIVMLIIILLPIKFVCADTACSANLTANKTEIELGKTVTLHLRTSGLEPSNKIRMFAAVIEYNSEVFEELNVSGNGATKTAGGLKSDGKTMADGVMVNATASPLTTDIDITITLKVKNTADFETSAIKLASGQIVTLNGTNPINEKSVDITKSTPTPTPPPATPTPTPATATPVVETPTTEPPAVDTPVIVDTPVTGETPTTETKAPQQTKKPTTTKNPGEYPGDKLPQTGTTVGIIAAMSAGIGGAGIALFKYFQYKKILK